MSNSISLTASMRSNLLSLQNIAGQVDLTQNRLSTGLKVNSAIDNPSSYYTAVSLNNRASDLSALLDSMAQGIQTIKAATEGLQAGAGLLEHAAATAEDTLTRVQNLKIYSLVGTKEELLHAVSTWQEGDGLIVLSDDIDMGETTLTLKDKQQLVGLNYIDASQKAAKLSFSFSGTQTETVAIQTAEDNLLSDLQISYRFDSQATGTHTVINNNSHKLTLNNLRLNIDSEETPNNINLYGIRNEGNASLTLNGNFYFSSQKKSNHPTIVFIQSSAATRIVQNQNSTLNVNNNVGHAYNAFLHGGNALFLGDLNITNTGGNIGMFRQADLVFNGRVNLSMSGTSGSIFQDCNSSFYGTTNIRIIGHNDSVFQSGNSEIYGQLNILLSGGGQGIPQRAFDNHTVTLKSGARLWAEALTVNSTLTGLSQTSSFLFETGSQIGWKRQTAPEENFLASADKETTFTATDQVDSPQAAGLPVIGSFPQEEWDRAMQELDNALNNLSQLDYASTVNAPSQITEFYKVADSSRQYREILSQYDSLIKDSSYKGINLLREQNLEINFNENRTAGIKVPGYSASAASLGLVTSQWENSRDIAHSLSEIADALNQIRQMSGAFGNYYSLVTTREDFTQNLINVLTEGADKLTLADMNEESANMLALQTRQQLAVNSLSLASQASQSILKLF